MSIYDLMHDGSGQPYQPDPIQREAAELYETLRKEVGGLPYFDMKRYPTGHRILRRSVPELQLAVVEVAFLERFAASQGYRGEYRDRYFDSGLIKQIVAARPLPTPARVAGVLRAWSLDSPTASHWYPALSLLRLVSTPPTPIEVEALGHLRAKLTTSSSRDERKLVERIDEMLAGDGPHPLRPGGTWSARVLRDIDGFAPEAREAWQTLLRHLIDSRNAEPTRRWMQQLSEPLDAVGRAVFQAHALDWIALGPMPDTPATLLVPERDADYLKGFVWAIATFPDVAVARALADLAADCFRKVPNHGAISSRVGNACVRVLGEMPGLEAVAQLGRLRTRVKYAVGLKLIAKALADAAAREGLDPQELEELAVPTFDLDATGACTQAIGDALAEIRIVGTSDVTLSWKTLDGRPLKNTPAAVRETQAAELTRLKKTVKDLLAILPAQRARLEQLPGADREIPFDTWRARYVNHPLLGQMSRRLIWQFSDGSRTVPGALSRGQILDADDQPLSWLSSATTVRLWHPMGQPRDLVQAWRRWLDRHAMVQPFKQAHREVYGVAVGEQTTRTYSSRFAAHILRQHQLAALCRERGWHYMLQGDWDSGGNAICRLPRWNLQVTFEIHPPVDRTAIVSSGVFEFITTGHLWFSRDLVRLPLTEVPALAFSEAMRDVDLFVSVCGAGYDPTWVDRPPTPTFHEYWLKLLGSPLSESAEIRQAVLEDLIPRLTIGTRLTLEDGFLVVRGDVSTYRIHLASANVVREPDGDYLCLAPARRRPAGREARFPFEGDILLVMILSKAFLLADDKHLGAPLIVPRRAIERS